MRRLLLLLSAVAIMGSAQKPTPAFIQEILAAHNAARAKVGTPALIWSDSLAKVAQDWADTLLKNGKFEHRPLAQYGENLHETRGGNDSPAEAISGWVAEQKDYNAATNECKTGRDCLHYTQVVSRSSRLVGCAVARDGTRREVWVCNYDPPGNVVGRRPF